MNEMLETSLNVNPMQAIFSKNTEFKKRHEIYKLDFFYCN